MSIDEHVVEQQSVSLFDEITTKLGSLYFAPLLGITSVTLYMYSI